MADIVFEMKHDKGEQNTAIFCVPKKADNTGVTSFRTCLDFRFLNSISKMPKFQLPSVQEALDVVAQNRPTLFCSIDITSTFFHIPLKDQQSKEMIAFSFEGKRYRNLCIRSLASIFSSHFRVRLVIKFGLY